MAHTFDYRRIELFAEPTAPRPELSRKELAFATIDRDPTASTVRGLCPTCHHVRDSSSRYYPDASDTRATRRQKDEGIPTACPACREQEAAEAGNAAAAEKAAKALKQGRADRAAGRRIRESRYTPRPHAYARATDYDAPAESDGAILSTEDREAYRARIEATREDILARAAACLAAL